MAHKASRWEGDRFVLVLYTILVALAGLFGYIIGLARPKNLDPRLFMFIDLPPNAFGMALYGAITIGAILGVLLLLVRYIAREYDTVENRG
jgi:ABC-type antimicrobial peptide transport system permease subunit